MSATQSVTNRAMGFGLKALNRFAGHPVVDKAGLREPAEQVVFQTTKAGFKAASAAGRGVGVARKLVQPVRFSKQSDPDQLKQRNLFDLSLSDEQDMFRDATQRLAAEQLRPAASAANEAAEPPAALLNAAAELGFAAMGVPEALGGAGAERSAITNAIIAEALGHGDMGLAWACLAPCALSNALVLWGDGEQQADYLPAFVGEKMPAAAMALVEPQPLFDPFALKTTARRSGGGFVLDGVKSMVPLADQAELFLIAATLEDKGPALFIVEASNSGLAVESAPAMGLRAAATGRLQLRGLKLPSNALLGHADQSAYGDCVRLGRLGWTALAVGCAQAMLDYLIPYVNERTAFGEPISHRQSVAFAIANMGIELEAMRLLTWRAASQADRGESFAQATGLARKLCADKANWIGSEGVQLLGGHGFVKEHPVERWYRDLRAAAVMEGGLLL